MQQTNTSLLRKSEFSMGFAKKTPAECFQMPNTSAPVNYDASMQLGKKQMDPANTFVESVRQNLKTQWALWNAESVSKNLEKLSFLWQKLAKKNGKKCNSTPINWRVLHRKKQKQQQSRASCTDRTQIYHLPSKKFEIRIAKTANIRQRITMRYNWILWITILTWKNF